MVLFFVGLADVDLSILRVQSRVLDNGHDVELERLLRRIHKDAASDYSSGQDRRCCGIRVPAEIDKSLNIVCPVA